MKILYLILARGGSKGLPGKNIKEFCGKPLINWTIEAIKGTKNKGDIVLSTDSQEIANVASKAGAEVPFLRPAELAADTSTSMDVIEHAIQFLKNQGKEYEIVVLAEPTSPLRESIDLDNAVEKLLNSPHVESVVGVSKTETAHPDFLVSMNNKGELKKYIEQDLVKRRQDLEELFFYEGSFYVSYTKSLLTNKGFYHKKTVGLEMPKWKSNEIDDIYDFIMCEALMKARLEKII